MTGPNSSGRHHLSLSSFEVFGTLSVCGEYPRPVDQPSLFSKYPPVLPWTPGCEGFPPSSFDDGEAPSPLSPSASRVISPVADGVENLGSEPPLAVAPGGIAEPSPFDVSSPTPQDPHNPLSLSPPSDAYRHAVIASGLGAVRSNPTPFVHHPKRSWATYLRATGHPHGLTFTNDSSQAALTPLLPRLPLKLLMKISHCSSEMLLRRHISGDTAGVFTYLATHAYTRKWTHPAASSEHVKMISRGEGLSQLLPLSTVYPQADTLNTSSSNPQPSSKGVYRERGPWRVNVFSSALYIGPIDPAGAGSGALGLPSQSRASAMRASHPAFTLCGRAPTHVITAASKQPFVVFDLGPYARLNLREYSITHYDIADLNCLRNWQILGSLDGVTWELLDTRVNDTTFTRRNQTAAFSISSPRHPAASPRLHHHLSDEMLGLLTEDDPNRPSALSSSSSSPSTSPDPRSPSNPALSLRRIERSSVSLPFFGHRLIAIVLTGPNSNEDMRLALGPVELYGNLITTSVPGETDRESNDFSTSEMKNTVSSGSVKSPSTASTTSSDSSKDDKDNKGNDNKESEKKKSKGTNGLTKVLNFFRKIRKSPSQAGSDESSSQSSSQSSSPSPSQSPPSTQPSPQNNSSRSDSLSSSPLSPTEKKDVGLSSPSHHSTQGRSQRASLRLNAPLLGLSLPTHPIPRKFPFFITSGHTLHSDNDQPLSFLPRPQPQDLPNQGSSVDMGLAPGGLQPRPFAEHKDAMSAQNQRANMSALTTTTATTSAGVRSGLVQNRVLRYALNPSSSNASIVASGRGNESALNPESKSSSPVYETIIERVSFPPMVPLTIKLPTSPFLKSYLYDHDGDDRGIIYSLGTLFHTRQWSNPVYTGLCAVTSTALQAGAKPSEEASSILGRKAVRCVTVPAKNATFAIDFGCFKINVTAYSLRHYSSYDSEAVRCWDLQVCLSIMVLYSLYILLTAVIIIQSM